MNFWPRERFPFIPTVAAAIPFQTIQPHFNNPAWDLAQSGIANAYYATGVSSNSPWVTPPANLAENSGTDRREKSKSPTSRSSRNRDDDDSPPRRFDRERSRERDRDRDKDRRRRRSRDRRSGDREDRGRDRRDSQKRSREDDREERKRDRSPYERKDEDSDRKRDRSPIESRGDERSRSDKEDESPTRKARISEGDKLTMEAANYKNQIPNETIRIRGLAQHITENDIRQDIHQCGLIPKDIRLIRKKETGVSRGFAFVEFNNTEEALAWMEQKQGVLMLQDMYRAVMEYSIMTTDTTTVAWQPTADWDCLRCYAHNFKKRITCFKCLSPRPDSTDSSVGGNEISPHPTTKLMIRNLDPLTDEEALLKEVHSVSDIPVQSCRISRDSPTNLSRGLCYLEMKNVLEAIKLYNALTAGPLVIQDRKVSVSYCKLQPDKPEPVSWPTGAVQQMQQSYTLADVPQLAEYSARMYASNPTQKAAYLQYYTQFYTNQINQMTQADAITDVNSAAAVAQTAIQLAQTKKAVLAGAAASALSAAAALNGQAHAVGAAPGYSYYSTKQLIGNSSIGEPDSSTWTYDESSGYYFDPKTGLHFDPNTNYYYHSQEQVFMYWDTTKRAYMAATPGATSDGKQDEGKDDKKRDKDKPQDKVKVAKRIAKDMERWAKTLNQKKEVTRQTQVAIEQAHSAARSAATADIAFAVLERKEAGQFELPAPPEEDEGALVASYGGGSDSDEGAEEASTADSVHHTDWSKLACLLCKRQFPSKEGLQRHQQLSDLHKQNLETWYSSRGLEPPSQKAGSSGYRDRAKERRLKFGIPDTPKPNKLKEKYIKDQDPPAYEEPNTQGIPSGNLGSKMLQKMGWSEGMGLGKSNQGRTDIVQAVHRVSSAGLGVAGSNIGPAGPGATYKENVKRAAMARFSTMMD